MALYEERLSYLIKQVHLEGSMLAATAKGLLSSTGAFPSLFDMIDLVPP
jgi:hypothetical protein